MLDRADPPVKVREVDDWRDLIDAQYLPAALRWHQGFDDQPHLTPEALDRVEADFITASRGDDR